MCQRRAPAKLRQTRSGLEPAVRKIGTRGRRNATRCAAFRPATREQPGGTRNRLRHRMGSIAHPGRILIADDQSDVVHALNLLLSEEGFDVVAAGSPAAVLASVEGSDFDLALLDLNYTRDTTSGQEG